MSGNHRAILVEFEDANRELLAKFNPEECIDSLDFVPSHCSYHNIPACVRTIWQNMLREFSEEGFDAFQRITMLRLIGRYYSSSQENVYSGNIQKRFEISLSRILQSIIDPSFDKYRTDNDILLKDLGICRQKIFPAGAQVVEPNSGFHRSLVWRGGITSGFSLLKLLISSGGNTHWYQIHTHLSELEDFNPDGWDRCYYRIAGMLRLNPQVRGMWGGSWFYDPALEAISPRLAYLRKIPEQNGAKVFFSNVDIRGGALSKSRTRKELYEKGKYLPKAYVLIWPRENLIRWSEENECSIHDAV